MFTILNMIAISLISILSSPMKTGNAYLDPGSGSFLLQILLAALLGGLFVLRSYWGRVKTFFANLFSKNEQKEE
jgi:hypothetical protein